MDTPVAAYVETPLIKSFPISGRVPFQVYLKNEFNQPSGSFKSRGMSNFIEHKVEYAKKHNKKVEIFASSGGNAGLATSVTAAIYNVPCTVVLTETSKPHMKLKIESTGATVIVKGKNLAESEEFLVKKIIGSLSDDIYPVFCHPFDNELVWDGHAKMIDEIKEQLGPKINHLKGIICSVGGGGLYAGIFRGLINNELKVPVVAVETRGAPSLHDAIQLGSVVRLDSVDTIATSLASPYAASQALKYAQSYPTYSVLVDDDQTLASILRFALDHNVIIEPACGAALTPVYEPQILYDCFGKLKSDDIIVVIVCGGSSYGIKELIELTRQFS